jgi:fatty acid desaturase
MTQGSSRPLDEAIRAIPISWFQPSRVIYWLDLAVSAGTAWVALFFAVHTQGWLRALLVVVTSLAIYRAALFIHEITHRASHDVPGFTTAWNILVGVPILMPSFLYEGVHLDHHRPRSYGTIADPEYVPFGRRSPLVMMSFVAVSLVTQPLFAVRFALLAPLSWVIRPLRPFVVERCSSLVINHQYVRRHGMSRSAVVQEAATCFVAWAGAWLWWTGRLSTPLLLCWAAATSLALGTNAYRTLVAHRYDHDDDELTQTEQLLDSCTIHSGRGVLRGAGLSVVEAARAIIAPVGLRYHALHHWIPSLPYHRLGRTHRLLVATLRQEAPYHATIEPGFSPAMSDLLRRSAARAGRVKPGDVIVNRAS